MATEQSKDNVDYAVKVYERDSYRAAKSRTATLPELAAVLVVFFQEYEVRPESRHLADIGAGHATVRYAWLSQFRKML